MPPVRRFKEKKEIVEVEEGEEEEEKDGEEKNKITDINVQIGSTDMDVGPQESLTVCAIDCEMCYTKIGLELTRVSIYPCIFILFYTLTFSILSSLFSLSSVSVCL